MDIKAILNKISENEAALRGAWNLEGFTIGIVKNGELIGTAGYGKKDAEGMCDGDTVMPIGSITKSFTSLLLAMLVDEGKLSWDQKLREILPDLKLYDEKAAAEITLRDCLSHKTGLAGHDMHGVYCTKDDRKEAVETLQYLQPAYEFRHGFKYSNQMVMLAGHVAEVVTGKSWEELIEEKILKPLGMDHTTVRIADIEKFENRSVGYVFNGQASMAQPYLDLKSVAPAGGINSNAGDMAKYMMFQLGDGTWNGEKLVSKESLDEMHKTQSNGSPYMWQLEEVTDCTYGLGWFVDNYRGKKMVSHGGNTLGFSALLTLLPEENLGIVILSNGTSNFLCNVLTYDILDEVLGVETDGSFSPWTPKFGAAVGPVFAAMAQGAEAKAAAKVADAAPAHKMEEYAGTYVNPGFGTMTIAEQDGNLVGELNGYRCMLMPYHYEFFDVAMEVYGMVFPIEFRTGMMGGVMGIDAYVEGTPGVNPVMFVKQQ